MKRDFENKLKEIVNVLLSQKLKNNPLKLSPHKGYMYKN